MYGSSSRVQEFSIRFHSKPQRSARPFGSKPSLMTLEYQLRRP